MALNFFQVALNPKVQKATATYFIDKLALRVGGEKASSLELLGDSSSPRAVMLGIMVYYGRV